ncbi:hypothetical protein [Flavobacterium hibernum]|uniref:DUF3945 domain-containing protein n=1 Tax=Flavobacterium hibernum TaxID=37752 RepID=A0A0D0EN56_9FLAO|nr:hypothetical protein [Flavobacterium hibernum]KIO54335.1 hypothetical protein IW18_02440 [Flavobacterium hibernum]OXA88201.1 hypothetical protein B0A73_10555 [Flavobacterium hibernum]STO10827.1 Uncharacterised protein [Flavobacterium hibernum]
MNEKNFEYLRDQIKYTGFGEALESQLKEKMQKEEPNFTLTHNAQYGNDTAAATLNFNKSKESDLYFFNSYKVELQKENSKENLEQTFYINKGSNITMKEAYNLMEGRSVNKDLTNKEGEIYNSWVQIDFKQTETNGNFKLNHYHQNYGYDLEATLSKHPIKELETPKYKEDLINSLKKGNLQSATFQKEGNEIKQYIEASPQFKTINVYDSNLQRIDNRKSTEEKQSETQQTSEKQGSKKQNQSTDDDGPEVPKEAKKKKKSQSM